MKLYIWQELVPMTDSWHSEAGVVALAHNRNEAWQMVLEYARSRRPDSEAQGPEPCDPVAIFDVPNALKPAIWVFPNAGCC